MKRRLRIAVSVFFAVVAVALIALWVRSYWWRDGLHGPLPSDHTFNLSTAFGRVRFATFDGAYENAFTGVNVTGWGVSSRRIDGPPSLELVNTPLSNFGLGFAGSWDRYGVVAILPIWFPIMLASIVAVAPWPRLSWRFSLRTLLIATTLFAVALGLVCYTVR